MNFAYIKYVGMGYIMKTAAHRRKQGYSLMELMVVIGILGIIMSVAAMDYVKGMPKRRVHGAAFDIVVRLRQARMMAASANAPAEVSISGRTITTWVDRDGDGVRDAGEESSMEIDPLVDFFNYPNAGTFDARGMFNSPGSYLYIYINAPNVVGQTVYVFPSGHVDLYYY